MEQNKIVFFSDLDDTLIFSKRKVNFKKDLIVGSFDRNGEPFSYFYKETKILLDLLIDSGITFVPNTARNLNAYRRTIFYNNPKIKYAILNFGGVILENNTTNKQWEKFVNKKMKNIDLEKYSKKLKKKFKFKIHIEVIDNFYISISNRFHRNDKKYIKKIEKILSKFVKNKQLKTYFNKNSFALYPSFLGKEKAMKFLTKKLKPDLILGAGDSNADKNFMKLSHIKILPFMNSLCL